MKSGNAEDVLHTNSVTASMRNAWWWIAGGAEERVCVQKVGGCSRELFKCLTRRRGGAKKSREAVRISSCPLRASAPSRETRGPLNLGAS